MGKLSFDAGAPAEPIEFDIHGRSTSGETWVETFHAEGDMAAGQVFEWEKLGANMQRQARELQAAGADAVLDGVTERALLPFFEQALVEGEYPRFRALLDDWRNRPVSLALLMEIMEKLIEASADRPTVPSSPSSGGRGITPATSGAASSSPVLPPAASPTSA